MTAVSLAMLVKDEESVLPATLARVVPIIDAWTVIDTGSTDRTRDIVEKTLSHLPGQLLRRDFDGFGPARTQLLRAAAGQADYTLMLDADHTLHIHGDRPEFTADAYMLRVNSGSLQWRLPLLTRSSHPFEYRGAAHAYLASNQPHTTENTDWLAIDGGPGATRQKLERDLQLLTQAFTDNPTDPRTIFYLARTHDDLDHHAQAITYYQLRASMDGWNEETYYARYRLGCLLTEHISFHQGAHELLQAWHNNPSRIEALRALANAANNVADKATPPTNALFLHPNAYKKAA